MQNMGLGFRVLLMSLLKYLEPIWGPSQEEVKVLVVGPADGVAKPRTVVVHTEHLWSYC